MSSLPTNVPIVPPEFGGKAGKLRDLSARDWVAVWFAAGILVLIAIICGFALAQWRTQILSLNLIPRADQKDAIANFKELTTILDERTQKIFDLTITKGLLPIFATLIGFLLGKETSRNDRKS